MTFCHSRFLGLTCVVLTRSDCQMSVFSFCNFFGGLNDALGVGRRVLFLKKYSVNENFQDDLHSQHNYRPNFSNPPTSTIVRLYPALP